jgi:carnitine O-palmitoyltransferase 1
MDKSKTVKERAELLCKACSSHQDRNRQATVGNGLDRHLFVLLVLSKGLGLKSAFLERFAQQKWLLSTSQPPIMTNQLDESKELEQWVSYKKIRKISP